LDMRLERDIPLDGLSDRLNNTLPSGIHVLDVEQVEERAPALQTQVVGAEYEVRLIESDPSGASGFGGDLEQRIESLLAADSIVRSRRGKQYDLRPLIEDLCVMNDKIVMKLTAREGATGRPEEVLDALGIAFDQTRIERTRLFFSL